MGRYRKIETAIPLWGKTIVDVAKRIPDTVLQKESSLLMYYDNALMRMDE